jgi:hypothetical protein
MKAPMQWWWRLAARERRMIILAASLLGAATLGLRVLPAFVRSAGASRLETLGAQETLRRSRGLLAAEPAMRESLAVRAAELVALAPQLFGGATANEAAAEFSSFVSGMADRHRIRLVRQEARPDSGLSLFTRLAMRVEAEGDVAGITAWLATLEEGDKLVSVRSVALGAAEPSAPATMPEKIRADVTFEAWAARAEN